MLNRENGRKVAMIGFALQILGAFLGLFLILAVKIILKTDLQYELDDDLIYALMSFGGNISSRLIGASLITAIGYALIWFDTRDVVDLITLGCVGLSWVCNPSGLWELSFVYELPEFLVSILYLGLGALSILWLLALAYRIKDKNQTLALLLCAAFLYQALMVLIGAFGLGFLGRIFSFPIYNLGSIACLVLCLFAAKEE